MARRSRRSTGTPTIASIRPARSQLSGEALKAARLAEAGVVPVKTEAVYPARVRGKVTVASYAMEWLDSHPMAPHTRKSYTQALKKHIIPAVGGRVLADVTAADIRVLFRHMERDGASRDLLAKVKTVLSSMLQTAAGYADNVRGLPLG